MDADVAATIGRAQGTGQARDAIFGSVSNVSAIAGLAEATGEAYSAGHGVLAGTASGMGEAFNATIIIAAGIGFAYGTGVAYNAAAGALAPRHITATLTPTGILAALAERPTMAAAVSVRDGPSAHVED
jgi:hypothetical protein